MGHFGALHPVLNVVPEATARAPLLREVGVVVWASEVVAAPDVLREQEAFDEVGIRQGDAVSVQVDKDFLGRDGAVLTVENELHVSRQVICEV